MKISKIVGFVLLLVIFTYSAITIFGSLSPLIAGFLFFAVVCIISLLVILNYKSLLRIEMGFIVLEVIIICAALSFLLGSARAYQIGTQDNPVLQDALTQNAQIANINDYYTQYIDYLNSELNKYKASNQDLQKKIDTEKARIQQILGQAATDTQPITRLRYEDDGRYEREEDDD